MVDAPEQIARHAIDTGLAPAVERRRDSPHQVEKLSWEGAAREIAASPEDWRAGDTAAADGLNALPWR